MLPSTIVWEGRLLKRCQAQGFGRVLFQNLAKTLTVQWFRGVLLQKRWQYKRFLWFFVPTSLVQSVFVKTVGKQRSVSMFRLCIQIQKSKNVATPLFSIDFYTNASAWKVGCKNSKKPLYCQRFCKRTPLNHCNCQRFCKILEEDPSKPLCLAAF